MKKIEKKFEFGGKEYTLSTGDFAQQATGACMARCGDTVVMATVVSSPLKEDIGYFPLSVEYKERLSAGGKIKGSRWVKRDGRPTDEEILVARLIDRSIRPLFPKGYNNEVQVIVQVLAVDDVTSPDIVGGIAVTAAIEASNIPWEGPMIMSRVSIEKDKFVVNPDRQILSESDLDLVLSTANGSVVMIESGAKEVSEDKVIEALEFGKKENAKLEKYIKEFSDSVGAKKETVGKEKEDANLVKKVKELSEDTIKKLLPDLATKEASYADLDEAKHAVMDAIGEESAEEAAKIFEDLLKKQVRKIVLSGKRADGRKHDELRKLSAKVSVLPRVHGSAIFQRGQTQALTVATLGAPSLSQLIETAEGEQEKRYIHHYSMPPYSTGEAGRFGFPGRREIGHGALAERALLPVVPSQEDFPYTIHVVTEILSSNGSTSMASTCGSTLSLMDAGVPIKAPVAGIAMGVIVEDEKNYAILTDIVGLEDGNGDMDFKVAGTKDGITALQLDVKTLSLNIDMLKAAFKQAKKARLEILKVMLGAIDKPRKGVSEFAPKNKSIVIPQEKIGELIGPGGKTIKKLMADTDTEIDVNDDGKVNISGEDGKKVDEALEWVESLTKVVEPGQIYKGKVKRIENYGAFVEILPNKDGLVHVSSMSEGYVGDPNEIVKIGDEVEVRVKKIDDMGRIDLSMILDPEKEKEGQGRSGGGSQRGRGGRSRDGGRRFDSRRDSRRGGDRSRRQRTSSPSGPHFPTSRLMEEK